MVLYSCLAMGSLDTTVRKWSFRLMIRGILVPLSIGVTADRLPLMLMSLNPSP